jgi:putative ABC transport system permease protein
MHNNKIEKPVETEYVQETLENVRINEITNDDLNLWQTSNLPDDFKYQKVDQIALKNFLISKDSLLGEEPYFSTIILVAKQYNLNPLILFAISGQEQGFVPKENSHSKKIANNPFNVYVSWQEYNTDIEDASRIVCRTIINLCKDRPNNEEAFKWINRLYAEDANWSNGVSQLYIRLKDIQTEGKEN